MSAISAQQRPRRAAHSSVATLLRWSTVAGTGAVLGVVCALSAKIAAAAVLAAGLVVVFFTQGLVFTQSVLAIQWVALSVLMGKSHNILGSVNIDGMRLAAIVVLSIWAIAMRPATAFRVFSKFKWGIAFLGYCALSILWANSTPTAIRELMHYMYPIAITLLVVGYCRSERDIRTTHRVLEYSAIIFALINLALLISGHSFRYGVEARFLSATGNAGAVGGEAITAGIVALLWGSIRWRFIWVGILFVELMLTRTRITEAGSLVVLAVYIFSQPWRPSGKWLVTTIAGAGGSMAAWFLGIKRRLFSGHIDTLSHLKLEGRGRLWSIAWHDAVLKHPMFGAGLGSMFGIIAQFDPLDAGMQAHNDYLRVLGEGGIVGLGIGLIALIWGIRWLVRSQSPYRWMALAMILFMMVCAATDNPLDSWGTLTGYIGCFIGFVIVDEDLRKAQNTPAQLNAIPQARP